MSKAKVPPARPGPQEAQAPRTIPLSEITITWPALRDFEGEPEAPITLSGKQLGAVVAWMARTVPGNLTKRNEDDPWDAAAVRFDLRGLAEILRGLGAADLQIISVETSSILPLLAKMAEDLAGRLAAAEDVKTDFKDATVTIGAAARCLLAKNQDGLFDDDDTAEWVEAFATDTLSEALAEAKAAYVKAVAAAKLAPATEPAR